MNIPDSFFPYEWWIEIDTAIEWCSNVYGLRGLLCIEAQESLLNDVEQRYGKSAKEELLQLNTEQRIYFTKEVTWDSENFYVMIDRRTK